jgi:hypothetical protein
VILIFNFTQKQKGADKMIQQETESLKKLARSWNNLDTSFIEKELAENFTYESQWVLMPIKGNKAFLNYLQSKFQAIKSAMRRETMSVTAELALHPAIQHKPIIVLTQITREGVKQVSLLIKTENEKISRIDVCFIPDPNEAALTGEFPK